MPVLLRRSKFIQGADLEANQPAQRGTVIGVKIGIMTRQTLSKIRPCPNGVASSVDAIPAKLEETNFFRGLPRRDGQCTSGVSTRFTVQAPKDDSAPHFLFGRPEQIAPMTAATAASVGGCSS